MSTHRPAYTPTHPDCLKSNYKPAVCGVSGEPIDWSVKIPAGTRLNYQRNGRVMARDIRQVTVLADVLGWHTSAEVSVDGVTPEGWVTHVFVSELSPIV